MKKVMTIFGAILFASLILTSCSGNNDKANEADADIEDYSDNETRDMLATEEIKQVDIKNAKLPPTSLFTPELIKSIVVFGTEPFWDIKFKETHAEYNDPNFSSDIMKIYYRKDSDDQSRPKLSEVLKQVNNNTVEILCTMKNVPGKIVIKKEKCSDGMSDDSYPYSVEFKREKMDTFIGCGR